MTASLARAADEVWVQDNNNGRMYRFLPNGTSLGFFGVAASGSSAGTSMEMVGGEIWVHDNNNGRFYRYLPDTTSLGFYGAAANGSAARASLVVVGNEVWVHDNNNGRFYRYQFNGTSLGFYSAAANGSSAAASVAVVGNEVWVHDNNNGRFYRYQFNGTSLGFYSAAASGSSARSTLVVVGSEAWVHDNNNGRFYRYQFNGTSLGFYSAAANGSSAGADVAVVNNEVWVHDNNNGRFYRYLFDGTSLGFYSAPANGSSAGAQMVFVHAPDCNSNGVSDFDDIDGATSEDCNTNVIPDECDIAANSSDDCNTDGIPDECQTDCNNNDIPDNCDLLSNFSPDCNTNAIPDECDIAGPTSVDCNGTLVPDECDIFDGVSEDCNLDGDADECEANSGDKAWVNPGDGDFYDDANWSPNGVPSTSGNAIVTSSGPGLSRCILDADTTTTVCSVQIYSTGDGAALVITDRDVLRTNADTTIDAGGTLDMQGGELGGGPVYNNSNTVTGFGLISSNTYNQGLIAPQLGENLRFTGSAFENQASGTTRAVIGSLLHITSTGVSQEGMLDVYSLGGVVFDEPLLNASGATINLLGGTMSTGGLTNAVGGAMSGFGVIFGGIQNDGVIDLIADLECIGNLNNEGTIVVQSGLLTITGDLTGGGVIIGGFGGRGGAGGLRVLGDLSLGVGSRLELDGGRLTVEGDVDIAIADGAGVGLRNTSIAMVQGTGRGERTIEAMAEDAGPRGGALSDAGLFVVGELRIGAGSTGVRLVNRRANGGIGRSALYVGRLVLEAGSRLDLAGMNIYYGELSSANLRETTGSVVVTDSVGGGGLRPLEAARRGR